MLDANFRFRSNTVDENRDLIYMHLMNNDAILTKENHIDIFTDGEKKFNQLLTDIRNAKTFIHIQYYIFRYDGIGKEIIDALTEKAKEGVRVRLLYDDLGSRSMRKKILKSVSRSWWRSWGLLPFKIYNSKLALKFSEPPQAC